MLIESRSSGQGVNPPLPTKLIRKFPYTGNPSDMYILLGYLVIALIRTKYSLVLQKKRNNLGV